MSLKLHPSYITDIQSMGLDGESLSDLWIKSSVTMYSDSACLLQVENPCAMEVINIADIRFLERPTITIIDKNGNELYVDEAMAIDESFGSTTPAPIDTSITTGYFKRLRVNSTNEDGIDIRTGGSIAADQTIYANVFTTGGQNVTGTAITNWNNHLANTSNPHSTTFAQLLSKPTTLSGFGITDGVNSTIQYTNPTWLAGIDATTIKTGTIDPARLPVMPTQAPIISTGDLTTLTTEQQAQIVSGTIVTTTDGNRYVYNTGTKTLAASYIQLADITPDWSVISNRPSTVSTWSNDAGYITPTSTVTWSGAHTFSNNATFNGSITRFNGLTQFYSTATLNADCAGFVRLTGANQYAVPFGARLSTDNYDRWCVYADGSMQFLGDVGSIISTVKGVLNEGGFNYALKIDSDVIITGGLKVGGNAVATTASLAGYSTTSHNHDATYFKLAAGSVHAAGTFLATYPTLAVGDGQYGMSALGGSLNLYSANGTVSIRSRSGSANAVYKGDIWHSGNFNPATKSDTSHGHTLANITGTTLFDVKSYLGNTANDCVWFGYTGIHTSSSRYAGFMASKNGEVIVSARYNQYGYLNAENSANGTDYIASWNIDRFHVYKNLTVAGTITVGSETVNAAALKRLNSSSNTYGVNRLYRADGTDQYWVEARWEAGWVGNNSWRLRGKNNQGPDGQAGINTVLVDYAYDAYGAVTAKNANTARLLLSVSGCEVQNSTWNPLAFANATTQVWGMAASHSATGVDTGDVCLWLRSGVYTANSAELCMVIDGDYYANGNKKVWHSGNFSLSNPAFTGNLYSTTIQAANYVLGSSAYMGMWAINPNYAWFGLHGTNGNTWATANGIGTSGSETWVCASGNVRMSATGNTDAFWLTGTEMYTKNAIFSFGSFVGSVIAPSDSLGSASRLGVLSANKQNGWCISYGASGDLQFWNSTANNWTMCHRFTPLATKLPIYALVINTGTTIAQPLYDGEVRLYRGSKGIGACYLKCRSTTEPVRYRADTGAIGIVSTATTSIPVNVESIMVMLIWSNNGLDGYWTMLS